MEPLSDPLGDRAMSEMIAPPHRRLTHSLLFPSPNKPNWRLLKDHLLKEGKLDKSDFIILIE